MPEFQPCSQAEGEKEIKCGVYPFERTAVVSKFIQAIKFLPGFFKARMANGWRDAQRAFDGGHIGTEALPEH